MSKVPTCRTCDDSRFIEACGLRIPCRDCAPAANMKVARERFQADKRLMDPGALEAENKILRRLLWLTFPGGYGDDGEMQADSIDFKRMTAQEIEAQIERNNAVKMSAFFKSSEGVAWKARVLGL